MRKHLESLPSYEEFISYFKFQNDPLQSIIYEQLKQKFLEFGNVRARFYIWHSRRRPKGIHLYSAAPRGKTTICNYLFDLLPSPHKQRTTFTEFMQYVREFFKQDTSQEALNRFTKEISHKGWLLLIDGMEELTQEDLKLLSMVLPALYERGVVLIITSRLSLKELFKDAPKTRSKSLLQQCTQHLLEISFLGKKDFSDQHYPNVYFGKDGSKRFIESFNASSEQPSSTPITISSARRHLSIKNYRGKAVLFNFKDLFEKGLGESEYAALIKYFETFYICLVPRMEEASEHFENFCAFVRMMKNANAKLVLHVVPDRLQNIFSSKLRSLVSPVLHDLESLLGH